MLATATNDVLVNGIDIKVVDSLDDDREARAELFGTLFKKFFKETIRGLHHEGNNLRRESAPSYSKKDETYTH